MKTLLAFFYNNLEFLYLDPRYRITNSTTAGRADDRATLTITGPVLTVGLDIDRQQVSFVVAPTELLTPQNWFRVPMVRQFLDGYDESQNVPAKETAAWLRDNVARVEALFDGSVAAESVAQLAALRKANADKWFGPGQ
jgi:hypothetical protein